MMILITPDQLQWSFDGELYEVQGFTSEQCGTLMGHFRITDLLEQSLGPWHSKLLPYCNIK